MTAIQLEAPVLIEKESIPSLHFRNSTIEVHQSNTLRKDLERATSLGNLHHVKVGIVFMDDDGLKRVNTTIWATGSKYISLKGGLWIPISRIIEIDA
jgi:hypothetical protein